MDDAENSAAKQRGRPFRKGQSGNPVGKPRGARHKAVEALDILGRGAGKEIIEAVIKAAKNGDARCAELVLKRIWPEVKGRPVVLELPEMKDAAGVARAMQAVSDAMSAGQISPEEAQAVANVIEGHRRTVETLDLEARIAAIEAKFQGKDQT